MNDTPEDDGAESEKPEKARPNSAVRRPPAPPASTPDAPEASEDGPAEARFEPLADGWLDPNSQLHRRRHRTPPQGPIDRVRRRWRRWRRHRRRVAKRAHWYRPRNISLGVIGLIVLLVVSMFLAAYLKVDGIRRAPLLPLSASTPSQGTNVLLLASSAPPRALQLDPNSLVVELIHLGANYQTGQVIDLPRDLMIGAGASAATVASLYQSGGVSGLVGALQNTMGLTINHAVQTSFAGYERVTSDLGTVTISTDTGKQPFNAAQALAWTTQQNLAGGSIESGRRFQHWSKGMLEAALTPGVLLNPFKVWALFSHTTGNLVVDDTFDNGALVGFVWHLRALRPTDLHFYTVPYTGYQDVNGRRVLMPNAAAFSQLSTAVRTDNLATLGLFQ